MADKVQVTLTGNESKKLIAKAATAKLRVAICTESDISVILIGGTTVSALSEELGFGHMRISGRIDASGTRTALNAGPAAHSLLIHDGRAVNIDREIDTVISGLTDKYILVTGANAFDAKGNAGLAFAVPGGGSRGKLLNAASEKGIQTYILCGLNKFVPDLTEVFSYSLSDTDMSMGAAIELMPLSGTVISETDAFEILFGVKAFTIAGSGISSGEGTRTFILFGSEKQLSDAWQFTRDLKGCRLSGDTDSIQVCHPGCTACARHHACVYSLINGKI